MLLRLGVAEAARPCDLCRRSAQLLLPGTLLGDAGSTVGAGHGVVAVAVRRVGAGVGVVRLFRVTLRASVLVVGGPGRVVAAGVRVGIDVAVTAAAGEVVVPAGGTVDHAGVGVGDDLTLQVRSG